eukprot:3741883-Prymnesium_polylepis.1
MRGRQALTLGVPQQDDFVSRLAGEILGVLEDLDTVYRRSQMVACIRLRRIAASSLERRVAQRLA